MTRYTRRGKLYHVHIGRLQLSWCLCAKTQQTMPVVDAPAYVTPRWIDAARTLGATPSRLRIIGTVGFIACQCAALVAYAIG